MPEVVDKGNRIKFIKGTDTVVILDKTNAYVTSDNDTVRLAGNIYNKLPETPYSYEDNYKSWSAHGSTVNDVVDNIDDIINSIIPTGTVTVTTTSYTADDYYYILADDDSAGAGITVNLPPVVTSANKIYTIKKLGTTGNITIDGNLAETIDGATTLVMTIQYTAYTILCDGTKWHII